MTSTPPASITSFPRAHEFRQATFAIAAEQVRAYLDAIGDTNDYRDAVPPLAVVTMALGALQDEATLPEGSLHTGQEVEQSGALRVGEPLTMTGRVAQRSERQGYVVTVLELEVAGATGVSVRARATVMAPGGGA